MPEGDCRSLFRPQGLSGFSGQVYRAERRATRALADVPDQILIYTAYSVTNKTMVLWLSKDLGFSDQAAGALVGWVWAPAMTVFTLLAGSLTDAIGLRRTFFLGVAICTVARSVMVGDNASVRLRLACGVLAAGRRRGARERRCCLPRRDVYSTTAQRSIVVLNHLRDHECLGISPRDGFLITSAK